MNYKKLGFNTSRAYQAHYYPGYYLMGRAAGLASKAYSRYKKNRYKAREKERSYEQDIAAFTERYMRRRFGSNFKLNKKLHNWKGDKHYWDEFWDWHRRKGYGG